MRRADSERRLDRRQVCLLFREDADNADEDISERLPNCDLLIVDEAHQLDDAFDSVLSQRFSFMATRRDLESIRAVLPGSVTAAQLHALSEVVKVLKRAGEDVVNLKDGLGASVLCTIQDVLAGVLKANPRKGIHGIRQALRRMKQFARTVEAAIKSAQLPVVNSAWSSGYIDWSPSREWPRMVLGPTSVHRQMDYLWRAVSKKSILVSGTLYTNMPSLSMESARNQLNVDSSLAVAVEPVHAEWQFTPVTVCIVKEAFFLCKVSRRDTHAIWVRLNVFNAVWQRMQRLSGALGMLTN